MKKKNRGKGERGRERRGGTEHDGGVTYYPSESRLTVRVGTPDVVLATTAVAYKAMVSMPFSWAALARWMRRKSWEGKS